MSHDWLKTLIGTALTAASVQAQGPAVPARPVPSATAAPAPAATAPAGRVRAALVSERTALAAGETALLGVRFEIDPGWHLYAAARNDTGYPIRVEPRFPAGYLPGELAWPAPHRHISAGDLLDHVYEGQVLLLLPVSVPADAVPGTQVTLGAQLQWLVCKDVCVAGAADVTLSLPVATRPESGADVGDPGSDQALFDATRARLPVPPSLPLTTDLNLDVLTISVPGAASLEFVPAEDCVELPRLVTEGAVDGELLTLSLPPQREANARLTGSVVLHLPVTGDGTQHESRIFRLEIATPPARGAAAPPAIPANVSVPVSPGENP